MSLSGSIRVSVANSRNLITLVAVVGAFITYFSMYAFRKPFTAGLYEGMSFLGMDFKILLVITQVAGYTLSKFLGIKYVSELKPGDRIKYVFILIGIAWISLLLLGLVPYPYNFVCLFFNGLPLGMIWGIVFAFLEGRRNTELLAAGMASSFIVASGFVKSVGRSFVLSGVDEFWMPFVTGLVFVPSLLFGCYLLSLIPPPTEADTEHRTERLPMMKSDRRKFFFSFAPGIILTTLLYMALNAYRDFRDNFAVEIWNALGYVEMPSIMTYSEIPIAILVLVMAALMILVKRNRIAFYVNFFIMIAGGVVVLVTTQLFKAEAIHPAFWMIAVGFGMYVAYMFYHTVLFERWIALFKVKSNIGYLMYVCDSFGYLASVGVLLYKNFFLRDMSWLSFFIKISYWMGILAIILSMLALFYFIWKERTTFSSIKIKLIP